MRRDEPVAIVGMGALFPGSSDVDDWRRDVVGGRDIMRDVPPTHWSLDAYYDPEPGAPDRTYGRRGAFLDPVDFDPMEFGIPPNSLQATDSAQLYASERRSFLARRYRDGFDEVNAGEIFSRHLEGIVDDHVLELTHSDRKRIFNLGYYTWVEQQGVTIDDFDRRRDQRFWRDLVDGIPQWDRLIDEFNAEVGAGRAH